MLRFPSKAFRCLAVAWATICAANAQQPSVVDGAVIHTFPGDLVYPESVAVDPASGQFYAGSVKHGTLFRGEIGKGTMEVILPAGATTSVAKIRDRLIVVSAQ